MKSVGGRDAAVKLRTARGRSTQQQNWLRRQLNDPYVHAARRQGYRSRAAFKLIELDDRFHLLKPGQRVVDLGAAPGGWTQVAVARVKAPYPGRVVAVDLSAVAPIAGAAVLTLDFLAPETPAALVAALAGPADVVLSD